MKAHGLAFVLLLACQQGGPTPDSIGAEEGGAPDTPVPTHQDTAGPDAFPAAEEEATPSRIAGTPPPTPLLSRYDFGRRTRRFDLPGRLDEISGLAFSPDGRLFAHDDERGRVHIIDPVTGEVGKRFDLGEDLVRDDMEGIAIVGERFFLVSSLGLLYEFREGEDRQNMAYRRTDTGLGAMCEIEGLDYDARDDALLFACKSAPRDRDYVVIYRIPLDPAAERMSPLLISRDHLEAEGADEDFEPSALLVGPDGTYVMVSARQEALLEVDREGRFLAWVELSQDRHPQSEGLALGSDGTLYISDERNGRDARLTAYAPTGGES